MDKQKYQIEYTLNTSAKMLFSRLSTAGGLSEWFADEVNVTGKTFTFVWGESQQQAEVIRKRNNEMIRFRWLEEDQEPDAAYFEFKLQQDELTGDMALIITDFAENDEIEDAKDLWDSQLNRLRHTLGL